MRKNTFSKRNVTVSLSGEEWFAVLCRLNGQPLSLKGLKLYKSATDKLQSQILVASSASLHGDAQP